MPSYWWKCLACERKAEFKKVSSSKGITDFIWDELVSSSWDQSALVLNCPYCDEVQLHIAYEFPRKKDGVELSVVHIVGLGPIDNVYIPMMWETFPNGNKKERWFDFKYVNGRQIYGLNKPAVFTQEMLNELFNKYCTITGATHFP
jgi:hypothetical protein